MHSSGHQRGDKLQLDPWHTRGPLSWHGSPGFGAGQEGGCNKVGTSGPGILLADFVSDSAPL